MNKLVETQCPVCNKNQQIKELYCANFTDKNLTPDIFSARRNLDHIHYRIVECKCGMIFSNPILEENIINELYSKSELTYEKELENIANSYYDIFKKIFVNKRDEISVLEFGCGNGFFLKKLYDNGIKNVVGIEPGAQTVEMADPTIKSNIYVGFIEDYCNENQNIKYDVVCAFQTLDHLRDPISVLKSCYNLCKDNGVCLFVTHDTKSIQALILKEKSPIIDIEHIYLFNKQTLSKIVKKVGFSKTKSFNIKNTYSLQYWIDMTPLPIFLKVFINLLIKASKLNKLNISIKAGNIAVIGYKNER